jgi:hypothetical protein
LKLSGLIIAALFLFQILPVVADSTSGEISEAEVIAYAKNTWGWAEFSDSAIIVALDGSYSGMPFRDHVKALIVGAEFINLYNQGRMKDAGLVLSKYGAKQTISGGLKLVGMGGVVPVANLATWPVEWSITKFQAAVTDSAHETHLRYYFAARSHNSHSEIANALPGDLIEADVNGGFLTKSDQGWLYRSGGFINSVPYMTPAEFFAEAELHWQCYQAEISLQHDNVTLRQAFGTILNPAGPVISSDLVDQSIIEGQTATFIVAANGAAPFSYTWYINGALIQGEGSSSLTAAEPGQYQVVVKDANNQTAESRIATLTVAPVGTSVVLTAPGSGATISGSYTVRASAIGATKVEFWVDGVRRFTDSSSPYTWVWSTALEYNGLYQIVAKSFSGSTLLSETNPRMITIDNAPALPSPDTFEPNNSFTSATLMDLNSTTNGHIWTTTDADWFFVNVSEGGALNVTLYVPAEVDYELEAFGPNGAYIAGSYKVAGIDESLPISASSPGPYYFRVYGYPIGYGSYSQTSPYVMTIGFVPVTITINSQPQGLTVPWGAAATFSVSASSSVSSLFYYQWRRNEVPIDGANGPSYTTFNTQMSDDGDDYSVVVSNVFGAVTSVSANLDVDDPPDVIWVGAVSDDWSNTNNWSPNKLPNGSDIVRIGAGKTVRVRSSANASIAVISGAIVVETGGLLSGPVVLRGDLIWDGGKLSGEVNVAPGAAIQIAGALDKTIGPHTRIFNAGTISWEGDGRILIDDSSSGNSTILLEIFPGGVFEINTDADIAQGQNSYYGSTLSVTNRGEIRKTGMGGETHLWNTRLYNFGTLEILSGIMTYGYAFNNAGAVSIAENAEMRTASGTSSGTIDVEAGGLLVLSGSHTYEDAARFTGDGRVLLGGGIMGLLSGPRFELAQSNAVSGSFTLRGDLIWDGGKLSGEVNVAPGAAIQIAGALDKTIGPHTRIFNAGTISWEGDGRILIDDSSSGNSTILLEIFPGGVFEINTDADIAQGQNSYYGSTLSVTNRGEIRKTGMGGETDLWQTRVNNVGALNLETGILAWSRGFESTGNIHVAQSSELSWGSGQFVNRGRISGGGTLYGDVINEGVLSPGSPVGILSFKGMLALSTNGALELQIAGHDSIDKYDQISVSGNVALAGSAAVEIIPPFTPAEGQSFNILTASSLNGRFSKITGQYTSQSVVLEPRYTSLGALILARRATPFENWQWNKLGALVNDPLVGGYFSDHDGDSLINLLEYAFALDPLSVDSSPKLASSLVSHGGLDYLSITFTRPKNAADIRYDPKVTGNLTGEQWDSGDAFFVVHQTMDNGETETVTVRDNVPVQTALSRFMSLDIEMVESDMAGNYLVGSTISNGANEGVGFKPWQISLGSGSSASMANSTEATGDINSTNNAAFRFFGGVGGTYVDAIRPFASPLQSGDVFRVKIAYNWNGGSRGLNILATNNQVLATVNFGSGDTLGFKWGNSTSQELSSAYMPTTTVEVAITQLSATQLVASLSRNDGFTANLTSTGSLPRAAKVKFYNGGHPADNVNYALYANDLLIRRFLLPNP